MFSSKLIVALLVLVAAGALRAAERPVTIVVPFAAGGPTDTVARHLAEMLRPRLGQAVVIEHVGGAGGTLGTAKVAKSAPDGHTLLLHHIGMATSPALYRSLPYDTLADFEYLGMINEVPMTVVGRPSLPADDFAQLRQWIERQKGRVHLATAGLGAASHLCGLLLQHSLKTRMVTVPYKGTAPAMNDLRAGQVDLMCDQTTNTTTQIEGGKIKAYAVTTPKRLTTPALAGLPTLQEAGLAGFHVTVWHGLYAPKGTPAATLERLNAALRATLQDPEFIARQRALGAVVITDERVEGAHHKRFVQAEMARWAPVLKAVERHTE